MKKNLLSKAWLIWLLAALFYAYEFTLRVSPSVVVDDLIIEFSEFSISKASLGHLSALYFYAYALTQVPAGMLCDRFGTRKLITAACLLTAIGSFMFGWASTISTANTSRLLIGAGSAFAFVACLKLARDWFSPTQFPLIVGLTNAFGMLGAILGNQPLASLVLHTGWREAFYSLALIGLGLSLALWTVVRNDPNTIESESEAPQGSIFDGIIHALTNKQTWLLAIYGCLLVAPIVTFGEMWGASFFQARFMIAKDIASSLIASIFMGIAIGGPIIGLLTNRFPNYRTIMWISTCLALAALLIILYYDHLSLLQTYALLFFYGLFTSNMLLCFSLVAFQDKHANGAAIGFTNMMIMAGGAAFAPLVGKLLDILRITHSTMQGAVLPSVADFRLALFILPACLVLALGLILFIKTPRINADQSASQIAS